VDLTSYFKRKGSEWEGRGGEAGEKEERGTWEGEGREEELYLGDSNFQS